MSLRLMLLAKLFTENSKKKLRFVETIEDV